MRNIYTIESINKRKPQNSNCTALRFDGFHFIHKMKITMIICLCHFCKREYRTRAALVCDGRSKSCGCQKGELTRQRQTKYSHHIPALNNVYYKMMQRCYKTDDRAYKWYGAKGITVCEEWRNDYQPFLDWALANGWKRGLVLDKDIGGGRIYSPENCRLVTRKQNMNHMSSTRWFEYFGVKTSLKNICEKEGVNYHSIQTRIKKYPLLNIHEILSIKTRYTPK